MLANDSLDYFERRISRLESMYFRGQEKNNPVDVKNVENNNVLTRIEEMDSKLNALSSKVPEIRQIISKLNQLYPLITQKRKSLREISEKVNEFQRSKNEINEHLNSLNVLKSLTPVINKETYADAEVFRTRLEKIEIALEYLKPQVNEQTKDVDELLEIYENGIVFLSKVCKSWEFRLEEK